MKYIKRHLALSSYKWLFLLTLVLVPSFVRMFMPGIYSMQDFPYFRVVEYTKCVTSLEFPCRWAPDAGLGHGEPVFNFYSHLPFLVASFISILTGSSVVALKLTFILSILFSGIAMFFLSKEIWGNNFSALISSVLYVYAPYRAVDVWVRGALPESFAFIFFPLIFYFFEKYIKDRKDKWLGLFSLSLFLLLITHNLSVLLFIFVFAPWAIIRIVNTKSKYVFLYVSIATIFSALLASFYLLPAIFESQFVNLQLTTQGYFDFRAHFVTLTQLFISRYWGYGGSTWGSEDGLSLAIGLLQWISALLVLVVSTYKISKAKKGKTELTVFYFVFIGAFCLFMTHNKSTFLWVYLLPVMQYLQFPWRFLGMALFSFSLSAGYLSLISRRFSMLLSLIVVLLAILLNSQFFREDLWFKVSDSELTTGGKWIEQTTASIGDYWPKYGPIPKDFIDNKQENVKLLESTAHTAHYSVNLNDASFIEIPITYFPGWVANDSKKDSLEVTPSKHGFINILSKPGLADVYMNFSNTAVRSVGNAVSIFSGVILCTYFIKIKGSKNNK